jgi:hypothetical protein
MLTRLLPEQVSKLWDVIKYAIEQSVPPSTGEHPDKMNRILAAALSGRIDVWASYVVEGNKRTFEGIAVTQFLYDDASGIRNMLLYCVYGYNSPTKYSWATGLSALVEYAKANGCTNIVAYTQDDEIVRLASHLGADTSYRFISFNVSEIVKKLNNLNGG